MKLSIELNLPGDGRIFLNYWDFISGNDVIAELKDDKIMLHSYDENSNLLPLTETTLLDFIRLVVKSAAIDASHPGKGGGE